MEAFAGRARTRRQATSENARPDSVEPRDDLIVQERQIAEPAQDGLTNPEIGARLSLGPRTVEWHLWHVFTEREIRLCRDLANAIPVSECGLVSA
jgi:DNA-binding NarL/FixJ family response regulator